MANRNLSQLCCLCSRSHTLRCAHAGQEGEQFGTPWAAVAPDLESVSVQARTVLSQLPTHLLTQMTVKAAEIQARWCACAQLIYPFIDRWVQLCCGS